MKLPTELHSAQNALWPASGEHILAHFDDGSIVVYQAYRPETALYALQNGCFGGPTYSFNRMSWIKPNFLWMMYRCGWATKPGQEMVLGLRIRRSFFDPIVASAVASSWHPTRYPSREAWKAAVEASDVRLQWDPDHDPLGAPLQRRAVQLGLRGQTLKAFATHELLEVIDMTPFVHAQRPLALARDSEMRMPVERVYAPA